MFFSELVLLTKCIRPSTHEWKGQTSEGSRAPPEIDEPRANWPAYSGRMTQQPFQRRAIFVGAWQLRAPPSDEGSFINCPLGFHVGQSTGKGRQLWDIEGFSTSWAGAGGASVRVGLQISRSPDCERKGLLNLGRPVFPHATLARPPHPRASL